MNGGGVRRGNPLKFAFIRYKTREEVRRTIEQLDGWIVWGCKVKLTESRYRRNEGKGEKDNNGDKEERKRNGRSGEAETTETQGSKEKTGNGESYRDILLKRKDSSEEAELDVGRGIQTLGNSKIYLQENRAVKEKLNRCLVGETV
ncbi:hypothetical protein PIB30_079314 [Stylosanthes scabra]|uniref:RRM domain-containing protein n=1 Tax=Stylosanthes scabra TaxID=79078 RepID=A0ABU6QQS3_9FABA|nr:hypothetical protein [Stylosanthes scabra]